MSIGDVAALVGAVATLVSSGVAVIQLWRECRSQGKARGESTMRESPDRRPQEGS